MTEVPGACLALADGGYGSTRTVLQDAGISPIGVTSFMGHSVKALPVTFRVYGHVTEETFDLARDAVDRTLYRLRPVPSSGTVTELRSAH